MPQCPICRRDTKEDLLFPADVVVVAEIRTQNASWKESDGLCQPCLVEFEKRVGG